MHTYGATRLVPGPASKGIRAGQRTAQPPELVPGGEVHAVDEHGNLACGQQLALVVQAFDPPVEWGTRSFLSHCRACEHALRG